MRLVYHRILPVGLQNVGCDHVLNSDLQMDQCGVCGGNNTCVKSTETPSTKTEATTNDSISKLDIAKDDALADDHQLSIEHEHQREQEQQQQSPPAINESEASRKKKFSKKYQYEWIVRFSDLCSVTCSVGKSIISSIFLTDRFSLSFLRRVLFSLVTFVLISTINNHFLIFNAFRSSNHYNVILYI